MPFAEIFRLLRSLESDRIVERFAIGGAVGATFYLEPTATVDFDVDGEATRVFTAEHLAAIALEFGRTKDKLRLLQFLEIGGLDRPRFDAIILEHGLTEKWNQFLLQFPEVIL